MMTIVVIALTTQIIIIAHIHTISCRRDSNPDSPGSERVSGVTTTEPSAGRKPATRAEDSKYEGLVYCEHANDL